MVQQYNMMRGFQNPTISPDYMSRRNNQNQNAGQNTNQNTNQFNTRGGMIKELNPGGGARDEKGFMGGSSPSGFGPGTSNPNFTNPAAGRPISKDLISYGSGAGNPPNTTNVGGEQVPSISIYPPGSTSPIQVPTSNTDQIRLLFGLGSTLNPATSLSGFGEFGSQLTAGKVPGMFPQGGLNPYMGMMGGFNPYMSMMGGGFGGGLNNLNPFAFMMPGFGGGGLNPYMGMLGGGSNNNLFPNIGNFGNGGGLTGDLFSGYFPQNYYQR